MKQNLKSLDEESILLSPESDSDESFEPNSYKRQKREGLEIEV